MDRYNKMKYLGYLLYFIIAIAVFYYTGEYLTQESGSFGFIIGNIIRGLILVLTVYLAYIKVDKKLNR